MRFARNMVPIAVKTEKLHPNLKNNLFFHVHPIHVEASMVNRGGRMIGSKVVREPVLKKRFKFLN